MAAACGANVPRPSPDFAINMTGGEQIHLSQYKGKVCVVAFILTTCPHCQKTVQYLSAIQNEYGSRGVQVVASAIESMANMNVPDFIKRFQPSFPVGFNDQEVVQRFLQHPVMLRMFMPQLVFIDRQGTIRAQYPGEDNFFAKDQDQHLRDQIDALLQETPAPHKKRSHAKSS